MAWNEGTGMGSETAYRGFTLFLRSALFCFLDFIQEDMESMKKEFEMWSDELVRNQAQINKGSE